jgi:hypothetical protein
VRNLTQVQITFLITGFGSQGIRVKDFSKDAILQRQIRAAIARGLADRAGTGLHLHIDRFRDRRDPYTVGSVGGLGRSFTEGREPQVEVITALLDGDSKTGIPLTQR